MTVDLVAHFERFLGPIECGWAEDPDGGRMPFQVVRLAAGGGPGRVTFATLGLSRHTLEGHVHQELLMHVPVALSQGPVPDLLFQVGQRCLAERRPFLRGEVMGPNGPVLPGSSLEAFYAASPVYLPDDFAAIPITLTWLVPISPREAAFVRARGGEAFEDELVARDPDLSDPFRPSLDLGVGRAEELPDGA